MIRHFRQKNDARAAGFTSNNLGGGGGFAEARYRADRAWLAEEGWPRQSHRFGPVQRLDNENGHGAQQEAVARIEEQMPSRRRGISLVQAESRLPEQSG